MNNVSYLKVFTNFLLPILESMVMIFGGIFLMAKKQVGWIVAIITTIVYSLLFLIGFVEELVKGDVGFTWAIALRVFIILLFFAMSYLLRTKPFLEKYRPVRKTWIVIISAIIFIVMIDNILNYLIA